MSYFEQFMQANQAYVALHGQLNLPLKPKTRVAIVTCMDSRLHVAQALGLALGDARYLAECRWSSDRRHDSFASYFPATNGDKRDCGIAPYRLWCSDL